MLPTAAERNTPNLGSTLIIAPNSVAFNRFINIQMASGFNTEFLVFNTQFLVFDTKFLVFNANFLIFRQVLRQSARL